MAKLTMADLVKQNEVLKKALRIQYRTEERFLNPGMSLETARQIADRRLELLLEVHNG